MVKTAFGQDLKDIIIYQKIRGLKIWLGTIYYPRSKAREYLEEAERILIYSVQPKLNTAKKVTPPEPLTVINNWHTPDKTDWSNNPRFNKPQVLCDLDDVLVWDGRYWWTSEKLRIFNDD